MTELRDVKRLVESIHPLLAGHPPQIQGAVLADLLAAWLAGHITTDPTETTKMRERLLQMNVEMVRKLIPINSARIHGEG